MEDKLNICFCLGYESLVIPLTLKNNKKEVVVYTNRDDVSKFCKYVDIRCVIIPNIGIKEVAVHSKKVSKTIDAIIKDNSNDFNNAIIHFTHKNFDIHSLIIAKQKNNCEIRFHKTEIDLENERLIFLPYKSFKKNIYALMFNWILFRYKLKRVYGLDITYRYVIGSFVPIIKQKWVNDSVSTVLYSNVVELFFNAYKSFNIQLELCKNLLIHTDINEMSNYVDKQSLIEIQDFVLKQGAYLKGHPNRNFLSSEKNQYPAYLPGELLVNSTSNAIISIASATFRYSLQFPNKKSISLIELLKWKDEKKKIFYKQYIDNFSDNILYPKTKEELMKMMN